MAAVLVVEDEWIIAMTHELALAGAGHEVVTAADGHEALARAAGRRFDLVVTDYMMPRMDGLAFVRELRGLPGYGAVPVILATAVAGPSLPPAGTGLHDAVLAKPFRDEELVRLAGDLLLRSPGQAGGSSGTSAS